VTSGDNSNILIARVARETFGVKHVVARIYDPRRASIYERLGIATVATVAWTSARVLRHLLTTDTTPDWIDSTAKYTLVERRVPTGAAGMSVAALETAVEGRVAVVSRFGKASIPSPSTLLQEDDVLQVIVAADSTSTLDSALHLTEGSQR
jgi:trk system potassium uptake protein TrkA